MSVQSKILDLISGFTDPALRMDVSATIMYLLDVYCSGGVSGDKIMDSLYEICYDVLRYKMHGMPDEEIKKKARETSKELFELFALASAMRRVMRSVRPTPPI